MIDPCLTCLRRCSHPHTHHMLACRSTGKGELSRWRWSDTLFLLAFLTLCFFLSPFAFPLLTLFSSECFFPLLSLLTFSLSTFSPQNVSLLSELPSFAFSSLFYISERLSSQNEPHAFSRSFLYLRAVSAGCRPPQVHPAPLGHGYHDDPCALKKGGRRSSRKNVAEEQ